MAPPFTVALQKRTGQILRQELSLKVKNYNNSLSISCTLSILGGKNIGTRPRRVFISNRINKTGFYQKKGEFDNS